MSGLLIKAKGDIGARRGHTIINAFAMSTMVEA